MPSEYNILITSDVDPELLNLCKPEIAALANNTLSNGHHRKKIGDYAFSIRINDKGRIIYTYYVYNGKANILILDITPDHYHTGDSQRNRFLDNTFVKQYLEKHKLAIQKAFKQTEEVILAADQIQPTISQNKIVFKQIRFVQNILMVFDEVQETALNTKYPLIIAGPAGSGKTSVLEELMWQSVRMAKQQHKKVLYIAESSFLINFILSHCLGHPEYDECKDFLVITTYKDFFQKIKKLNPADISDGWEIFSIWYPLYLGNTDKVSKDFLKSLSDKTIYKEFRLLSGFSEQQYLDLKIVGRKQSLFDEIRERSFLFSAFKNFKNYCQVNQIHIPEFDLLSCEEQFYTVLVEEGQGFTNMQAMNLIRFAETYRIVFVGDTRQAVDDINKNWIYINHFLAQNGIIVNQLDFHKSYRCSPEVIKIAESINAWRRMISPSNKSEARIQPDANIQGKVIWQEITPKNQEALLKSIPNDTNTCIITSSAAHVQKLIKLGYILVFSLDEIKKVRGLQFEQVVLIEVLSTPEMYEFNKLFFKQKQHNLGTEISAEYAAALATLFIAITRTQKDVTFYQTNDTRLNEIIKEIRSLIEPQIEINISEKTRAEVNHTLTDWQEIAKQLYMEGFKNHAHDILKIKLNKTTEEISRWELENGFSSNNLTNNIITTSTTIQQAGEFSVESNTEPMLKKTEISGINLKNSKTEKKGKKSKESKKETNRRNQFTEKERSLSLLQLCRKENLSPQDIEEIKEILKKPLEINMADDTLGYTPLYAAVINQHLEVINLLLAHPNINVNKKDNEGVALIFHAIRHKDILKAILTSGHKLDLNVKSSGFSLLHFSVLNNYIEITRLLLDADCLICKGPNDGDTPFHLAVQKEHLEILRLLTDKRSKERNIKNNAGDTPLFVAVTLERIEALRILLDVTNLSDFEDTNNAGQKLLEYAKLTTEKLSKMQGLIKNRISYLIEYEKLKNNSSSPVSSSDYVILAIEFGQMRELKRYIRAFSKDFDINKPNSENMASLHIAIKCFFNNKKILPFLLALPNIDINKPGTLGNTPLHMACPSSEIAEILLMQKNINVNCVNIFNETPLHKAIQYANIDVLKLLLAKTEIDCNIKNIRGLTPLEVAFEKVEQTPWGNYNECIDLLIAHEVKRKLNVSIANMIEKLQFRPELFLPSSPPLTFSSAAALVNPTSSQTSNDTLRTLHDIVKRYKDRKSGKKNYPI